MYSHVLIFAFMDCTSGVMSKKLLPRLILMNIFPVFSSRSFMVSGLMFKTLIYFQLLSLFFWPHNRQDVSSPTRDQTCAPCSGSGILTLGPQGSLSSFFFFFFFLSDVRQGTNFIALNVFLQFSQHEYPFHIWCAQFPCVCQDLILGALFCSALASTVGVVRMGILVFFLILGQTLVIFLHWV